MNTTLAALMDLYARDLDKLHDEINEYKNETDIWKLSGEIKNTPGNLVLHICGNLKHFVGAMIAKSGYVRNREAEFNTRDVSKSSLLSEILETKEIVITALKAMDPELLAEDYPLQVFGKPMTHSFFLIHLNGHINWHMGHINYHRRILGY